MKKIIIVLGIALLFLVNTKGISQRTKQLNDRDSINHWEVGFDLLWLINKNTVPAKSVFVRYNFTNAEGAKRALRFRIGADHKSSVSHVPTVQRNDEIDLVSGYLRIGYEWQRDIAKSTGFFYGVDVGSSYVKLNSQIIDPRDSWLLDTSDRTWEIGASGLIGFIYKPSSWFTISIESSLNLIYRKRRVDDIGSFINKPEDGTGYWGLDVSKITSNFSPITVLNFSFNF